MLFRKPGRPSATDPWITPNLNKRVQIMQHSQDEATAGGFIKGYDVLKTVWGGFKPFNEFQRMRYSSIEGLGKVTHQFIFRYLTIQEINTETEIFKMDSSYYLKVEYGDANTGRIFRVRGQADADEKKEFFRVLAEEIEETGTGFPGAIY